MNVVKGKNDKSKARKEYRQKVNFMLRDNINPEKLTKRVYNETNTTSNLTSSNDPVVILALAEGRGQAQREVGLAALDLNSPILILCQLSDGIHYTDTLNKINVLNPVKILVPDTILESNPLPKLIELIKETFRDVNIIPVQRRYFNDKAGLEEISKFCSKKSQNVLQIISRKYYSISAAAALLSFLKNVSLVTFAEKCLKLSYQTKGGLMIDSPTSEKLELLYSLCPESKAARHFSLYGILNKCETRIGQRHLRVNILEPSCDIEFIRNRQEQIKILIENAELLQEFKENLKNFRCVESLLKICYVTPANDDHKAIQTNIQMALLLKNTFEAVKPLGEVVSKTISDSFEDSRNLLSLRIFSDIVERINCVIQPNIHENRLARKYFQYLYAVRAEVNETIDFLRQVYSETIDKINTYVDELSEGCLLPLKLIHTTNIGYHLQVRNIGSATISPEFEIIHKKGISIFLTTAQLVTLNDKAKLIGADIIRLSNSILCDMLLTFAKEIDVIYHLIGSIIDLDIIQSLADVSLEESFCCPTFSRVLRLEDAYHPLLKCSRESVEIVKNNVIATPQYNFFLISGSNMSGKTIYIKMIAIIQIMAQIGCFVPAKSASIRMCDKIFSRLGFQDNIEQSASSFTVELRDMEYIYSNLTPNSLVVIDELCRSTNPQEGEMICWNYCEKLLNFIGISRDDYFQTTIDDDKSEEELNATSKLKNSSSLTIKGGNLKLKDIARPYIFITTHFDLLTKLTDKFNNAVNLHMLVHQKIVDDKLRLEFKYKVQADKKEVKNYGLALARCLRFPSSLLDRAEQLIDKIEDDSLLQYMEQVVTKENVLEKTTASKSDAGSSMNDLERDVIDLYSYILLLMSTEQGKEYSHISIDVINQKVMQLLDTMSPSLRELLNSRSLEEIIGILNASSSFENSFSKYQ